MESLVSQVRDLLPDLGDGFVHLCIEYFDNAPEKVINALLEGYPKSLLNALLIKTLTYRTVSYGFTK